MRNPAKPAMDKKQLIAAMRAKMPQPVPPAPAGTSPGAPITANTPAIPRKSQLERM